MPLTPLSVIRWKYSCNDIHASVPLELRAYVNRTSLLLIYYDRGGIIPRKRHAEDKAARA